MTPVAEGITIGDLIREKDIHLNAANVGHVFEHCHIIIEALDRAQDKKTMADAFMADPRLLVGESGK